MSKPEQSSQPGKKPSSAPRIGLVVLVVILAIAAVGIVASVSAESSGPFQYACLSVTQQSGELSVATSGLIHYSGSEYYVSCSEGSTSPITSSSISCLTITPQTPASPYPLGSGMSIQYYLNANGHPVTLQGAPANATEITQPTSATIQVNCGQ
jgi:hypothetical protein